MTKTVVIFGAPGGIGTATAKLFADQGYQVVPIGRDYLNFQSEQSHSDVAKLLNQAQADVVVNCAGVFINGYANTHHETMNVNFGSNWSIISYYMALKGLSKPTRIIMIGSSSYTGGRQLYPLYSASKAALYNLWESAKDYFAESDVTVDLVNPVRTRTKMATAGKAIDPKLDYLEPDQVAEEIYKLVETGSASACVDMTF
jgi:ribitol-5-phosphate 2-dehydrogenase (NADP+) / D-ribitol-5-phosphate cytidylyltransferase